MDIRDTPIADSDIQCFNITLTLREILMDCPAELRCKYESDETTSDTDSEPSDMSSQADSSADTSASSETKYKNDGKKSTSSKQHANDKTSDESDSEDDTDCSTDSEDGDSDNEDGAAKVNANNEEATPAHRHCIQVMLQNGRMINVSTEPSMNQLVDRAVPAANKIRCVIGVINGRGAYILYML